MGSMWTYKMENTKLWQTCNLSSLTNIRWGR
jgi:hypothetical protein